MSSPLLRAENIVKRFGPVTALRGVSFDLRAGEIHALCGENGAGKSTLIKTLSGIHSFGSYEGELFLDGKALHLKSIADAERAKIGVIYQELALVPDLSVAENIFLGNEPRRGPFIDWLEVFGRARELLSRFAVQIDPMARVGDLGVGQQQLVEIVKALSKQSKILILDEPTAALSESEVEQLLKILIDLRAGGLTCVYISHKLDEVFAISDRITVLRDGASIATLETAATSKGEVIQLMVGREIGDLFPRVVPDSFSAQSQPVLQVENLSVAAPESGGVSLHDISFALRPGEVLGIGGLMGAGRTELLMHLFGAWGKRIAGRVELGGKPFENIAPNTAIAAGMVLVSEDRKRFGLVLEQSINFNLSLSSLQEVKSGPFLDSKREATRNGAIFSDLRVKAPGLEAIVGNLSGGNQQKIVLGKALLSNPKVIFLDEPTRGIDVGAKLEIYNLINRLTEQGLAVVLVSSELPELMGMSDRIIMLNEGKIGGAFSKQEATPEKLLSAAMGQEAHFV
ncbi:xylose ABC transporter ATP-binding protein [Abditibacterium utsteinense]|uniref:Xylose ABC transporter ATP-binding protein n=1 Tax=Abditibacterium utsteinense TaxID=1960156 RepID=A0A2S8SW78_9BACT|nr:sugar ABC transporter ATP-binding protein [Abditibacterium utsteinense]PQV65037.1 xylose ABC transporter ATP-binding protein [Abditibacterium utsteinense]